jgi:Tfp pilus assembly protein PilX
MIAQRLRHGEEGSVLVIAISLLVIMLAIGLASFSSVDTGQIRSREQRERESSLNLAEAVLYSQGFALAQYWPGNATTGAAVPTLCSSANILSMCPDPRTLASGNAAGVASANFSNVDVAASVTWTSRIRDNGGPMSDAYVTAQADAAQTGTNVRTGAAYTCPAPCKWDANGDLMLWVQARAVVRTRPRSVVALLKREQFAETFAAGNAVTAGSFETTNSGSKTIIDVRGSQVVVRCETADESCTDYDPSKSQVLPPTIVRDSATPPAMSDTQLARFMSAAQSASPSTYYTSCPADLTGAVVFVDVPPGTTCRDDNTATYNSSAEPGVLIMPQGKLSLQGSYYGIIYVANGQGSSGPVLTLESNSEVFGGVAVDGAGRLVVGQASGPRPTITYVPNAFNALATYGTTGLVQNTWRELPPT